MNLIRNIDYENPGFMEAQARCDLEKVIDIFFIRNTKKMFNYVDSESYLLESLKESIDISNCKGTCVILAAEYSSPFACGPENSKETQHILERSKIAKFILSQENPSYFLCGEYFFSNEFNVRLSKYKPGIVGDGNIGFRLCAAINNHPLNDLKYYFVSAANISDKVAVPKNEGVIYINDEAQGIRRISANTDSGWLTYEEFNPDLLDNGLVKHALINL